MEHSGNQTEPRRTVLLGRALFRFVTGLLFMGGMLFLSAGTMHWRQGWIFLGTLMLPAMFVTIWLAFRDPELLERRLRGRERTPEQRRLILYAMPVYGAIFLLPGFDHRWGWSIVPDVVTLAADGLIVISYLFFSRVLRENSFAGRTIEVMEGQKIISTGPYAIVRHPMYISAITMMCAVSLALGSWWSLLLSPLIVMIFIIRIVFEERTLLRDLPGYDRYRTIVRYRLIPGVW